MAATTTTSTNLDQHHFVPIQPYILNNYLFKWFTIHITDQTLIQELSSSHCHYEKTYDIEEYPCRVFLIEFEESKGIHINVLIIYKKKCSSKRMKSCWVCKWIEWNDKWLIDKNEIIDETIINKPDFYRLHGDRETGFGDGGYAFLTYPVWINENLPIKNSCRERLLKVFYDLNEERQDFHPHPSPVEDIIDPDLLPYKPPSIFDRDRWIERRRRQLKYDSYNEHDFISDIKNGEYNDLSEHEKLRDTYQWLPSEFIIDQNGKVDIKTPIHHLPVLSKYKQSYDDIAKIFHSMLPMFEQMKLIKLNSNEQQKLQVIIKVQSYNLKAGMKYSGHWHTEGQTENIIAVGVYYLDVDEQLEGGSLKFRPKYASRDYYEEIETDHYISSIKTGTAIVFSNSIPHRFQQIRNLTHANGRRRTFINFFTVDPEQPINISLNEIIYVPKDFIIQILQKWNDNGLPEIIINKILKMLNLLLIWQTKDFAKGFRARVRRSMLDEKSGWGWIFWGNCGTTEFVRALSAWIPRNRQDTGDQLHHTESD